MIDMIRGFIALIAAPIAVLAATQARAELTLCNRTSFRMEAAVGIEKRANVVRRDARRRYGLSARAHAVRLWRRAAAAKRRCRFLHPQQ
jgi:hypothetical protein